MNSTYEHLFHIQFCVSSLFTQLRKAFNSIHTVYETHASTLLFNMHLECQGRNSEPDSDKL